ncbi:MAG: hypothetical protein AMXMBFR4_06390 [Candidatus Hydrogenedentota bacterium]
MNSPALQVEITGSGPRFSARWRGTTAALGAVLVLVIFWYCCVWFQRPQMLSDLAGDVPRLWLPSVVYSVYSIRTGEFPLWNPYEFAGMPMFATLEYGPLYPPNWMFFLLPLETAHLAGAFLHQAVLALGVYVLLRKALAVDRLAAMFGVLCVALSGWSTFRMLTEFDAYRSAAYIPWIVCASDRVLRQPTAGRTAVLAILVALQFLAGETEIWVRSAMLLGLYTIFQVGQGRGAGTRMPIPTRPLVFLACGGVLAIGLVAVQLLPAFEASQLSLRSVRGMTFEQAFRGGAPSAASLLASLCIHDQSTHDVFIGFLPLLVAGYGLIRGKASTYFFAGIALVTFDLMLGENGYTARLYYLLPTGNWFRAPIRFLPFFVIAFSIVAAQGVDVLLRDLFTPGNSRLRVLAHAWLAGGCLPVLVSVTASSRVEFLSVPIAFVCVATARLLALRAISPVHARGAATLALIGLQSALPFTLYDLREFNIPKQLDFVGPAANVMNILERRHNTAERVYVDYAWEMGRRAPRFGTVTRIPCIDGLSPFMPRSYWDFIYPYSSTRIQLAHERSGGAGLSIKSGVWGGLALESGAAAAFDVLGVRYIVSGPGSELQHSDTGTVPVPEHLLPVYHEAGITVFENRSAWPRAFVVTADDMPTLESLMTAYRHGAVPAHMDAYRPQEVRISVSSDGGILVLTDQVYPGWQAYVNGARVEIHPVAGVFRGVKLPGGEHLVEFRYQPKSLTWGAGISAASLFVLILITPAARIARHFGNENREGGAPPVPGDAPPKSA